MPRVLLVPGLAVRRYARPAVDVLRAHGLDAYLLPAPGEPGSPPDLRAYGDVLAHYLRRTRPADLLVGLSVGGQAAAAAAAGTRGRVRRLVLVSPTVDPRLRRTPRLLAAWLAGGRLESPWLTAEQAPDWLLAGPRRIGEALRSAIDLHLEDVLPVVDASLVVVHAERDVITSHGYAAALAADHHGTLVLVPGATHSWPYGDEARFAATVEGLLP